jgi:hypothetical protein
MGWSILDADFTPNLVRIARRFTELLKESTALPPRLVKGQGDRIAVLVAKDIDFRPVFARGGVHRADPEQAEVDGVATQ